MMFRYLDMEYHIKGHDAFGGFLLQIDMRMICAAAGLQTKSMEIYVPNETIIDLRLADIIVRCTSYRDIVSIKPNRIMFKSQYGREPVAVELDSLFKIISKMLPLSYEAGGL